MLRTRHCILAALVLCLAATTSFAQIFKQVPSSALVVLKVANLDATSKKIADLATALGVAQQQPDFADPLAAIEKQAGIKEGVNKSGDLAYVFVDPATAGGDPSKSMLILVPVSDYKAFIGNWAGAQTDGDVTSVTFPGQPDPGYIAKWGDYAAITPTKSLVAVKPDGITLGGATAKEMDGKDFVVYANIKALRGKALPQIENLRAQAMTAIDGWAQQAVPVGNLDVKKFIPAIKVAVGQALDVAKGLLNDADSATLSINLGGGANGGFAITEMAEFAPASYSGKIVAQLKNTDASLLKGLPTGKYFAFGGSVSNPKVATKLFGDFMDPIVKELTPVDDAKPMLDMIDSMRSAMAAETGNTFGMMAPAGAIGQDPLIQILQVRHGNAKDIAAATHKGVDAQLALMKLFAGPQVANLSQTTFTANAKTVDGVSFDSVKTIYNINANDPQTAPVAQVLQTAFGGNGMTAYMGVLDANTMLGTIGLTDAAMSGAIAAVRGNDDPLARDASVKSVAAQLPANRLLAIYIPLDVVASTGLGVAKQMGMDMGVRMPENLPPVGITLSAEGTALREDIYVSTSLVQALTSVGMQIMQASRQPPGGGPGMGPGGPGGPGGL